MFKTLSFLITLIFLAFGLVLGVLNPTVVSFDLFIFQTELPLSILMALAIMLGMFISAFYFTSQMLRQKWLYKKLIKENQRQAAEVLELKKQLVDMETSQNKVKNSLQSEQSLPTLTP